MNKILLLTTTLWIIFSCASTKPVIPDWYSNKTILEKKYPEKTIGYGESRMMIEQSALREAEMLARRDLATKLQVNQLTNVIILETEISESPKNGYYAFVAVAIDQ